MTVVKRRKNWTDEKHNDKTQEDRRGSSKHLSLIRLALLKVIMKILLDIPLALTFGNWVWGEDENPDVSSEICLDTFPFMISGCWSRLLVKGLGIAIILGSCLNKIPIMRNLMNTKSTEGLSRGSTYTDAVIYANGAFYGLLKEHPLTAFGENLALLAQTVVIILMIWNFSVGNVSGMEHLAVVLAATFYAVVVVVLLPDDKLFLLPASITPFYLYSRISQIWETVRVKHTGAQSVITLSMNMVGGIIRVLTTLKEVGLDFAVLTNHILGVALNTTMFAQYFYYRSNTEQFIKDLQSKKDS